MDYYKIMSKTSRDIQPSGIRDFFDYARSIEGCISLGVGEPDYKTPYRIRWAAQKALEEGKTFYTDNKGIEELRIEISKYLKRKCNVEYDKENILVTTGGSEALDLFLRTFINPGDEIIVPSPSYVAYAPLAGLYHAKVIDLPMSADNGFRLTGKELKSVITPKTKAIIMTYPSNPTGAILDENDLEDIADALEGTDIMILADEIYSELVYDSVFYSVATNKRLKERVCLLNGFSKAYAMTGWRLAYICAAPEIIEIMLRIHQYSAICAPTISQYAAVVGMQECDDEIKNMVEDYKSRRDFVYHELNSMGLTCTKPEGAFYMFPSIANTKMSSMDFCMGLLKEKNVAVVPGSAFGISGEGYFRMSYSYSFSHLKKAMVLIKEYLDEIK